MARFSVYFGSGRAECLICHKIIKSNKLQINFTKRLGVHSVSGNAHYDCITDKGNEVIEKECSKSNWS